MPPVVLELMYLVFEGATKVQNYNRFILMHKAMLEALSVIHFESFSIWFSDGDGILEKLSVAVTEFNTLLALI